MTKQQKAAMVEAMKVNPNGLSLRQLLDVPAPHQAGIARLISAMAAQGRWPAAPPKRKE